MFSRRRWLATSSATLISSGIFSTASSVSTLAERGSNPVLRAAHITDVHVTDTIEAPHGVEAMFAHMFGGTWAPDLVLNTGDSVMGVDGAVSGARAKSQIDTCRQVTAHCKAPIFSCLGNHDVWDGAFTYQFTDYQWKNRQWRGKS